MGGEKANSNEDEERCHCDFSPSHSLAHGLDSRAVVAKMLRRRFMIPLLCVLLTADVAPASAPAVPPITVRVITFGPGDHPFFKFGHNAIWIHDERGHKDPVYNFGTFYFDSPWLIVDFLKGRFVYWLSVEDIRSTIYEYKSDNRSVFAQELNLTDAEAQALADALEENAKPANAAYKYDYYRDNCSTRVRDAIDRAAGGALRQASLDPSSMTFRDHTLRLTADIWWEYAGLDILLSNPIDKPIDKWQEMFLPGELQEGLRHVRLANGTPLVKSERLLVASTKPPQLEKPPQRTFWFFLVGALSALLLLLAARHAPRLHGLLVALLAGITGLLGTIFTLIWFFTNHDFSWHNENILQCAPWALGLVISGFYLALGKPAPRALLLARAGLAASALGVVLKVLPWFDQGNWRDIALFLPLWIGLERSLSRSPGRRQPR